MSPAWVRLNAVSDGDATTPPPRPSTTSDGALSHQGPTIAAAPRPTSPAVQPLRPRHRRFVGTDPRRPVTGPIAAIAASCPSGSRPPPRAEVAVDDQPRRHRHLHESVRDHLEGGAEAGAAHDTVVQPATGSDRSPPGSATGRRRTSPREAIPATTASGQAVPHPRRAPVIAVPVRSETTPTPRSGMPWAGRRPGERPERVTTRPMPNRHDGTVTQRHPASSTRAPPTSEREADAVRRAPPPQRPGLPVAVEQQPHRLHGHRDDGGEPDALREPCDGEHRQVGASEHHRGPEHEAPSDDDQPTWPEPGRRRASEAS